VRRRLGGRAVVTVGLAEMVAVRLGRLPIELVTVPLHPAARQPTTTIAASRECLFAQRRMMLRACVQILSPLPRSFATRGRVIPAQ